MTTNERPLLVQVAQHVDDLERATAFYVDVLGFALIAKFGPLVFVDLGGTRLLLETNAPPAMLYLRVDDLQARTTQLAAAGVEIVSEPHVIFTDSEGVFGSPGLEEWQAFFRDSEGNLVGLVSHQR